MGCYGRRRSSWQEEEDNEKAQDAQYTHTDESGIRAETIVDNTTEHRAYPEAGYHCDIEQRHIPPLVAVGSQFTNIGKGNRNDHSGTYPAEYTEDY